MGIFFFWPKTSVGVCWWEFFCQRHFAGLGAWGWARAVLGADWRRRRGFAGAGKGWQGLAEKAGLLSAKKMCGQKRLPKWLAVGIFFGRVFFLAS